MLVLLMTVLLESIDLWHFNNKPTTSCYVYVDTIGRCLLLMRIWIVDFEMALDSGKQEEAILV